MARGRKTGGGSRKGRPNKVTADLKAAILNAFDEVGGVSYLARVAREHPQVFCTLLGKVLPTQINGNVVGALTLEALVAGSYEVDKP